MCVPIDADTPAIALPLLLHNSTLARRSAYSRLTHAYTSATSIYIHI